MARPATNPAHWTGLPHPHKLAVGCNGQQAHLVGPVVAVGLEVDAADFDVGDVDGNEYQLWHFGFADRNDYNSIRLWNAARYRIVRAGG